jgi:hypothetical protein
MDVDCGGIKWYAIGMKLLNPFLVRGHCGPEYFCDREKETVQLVDSLVDRFPQSELYDDESR